MASVAPKRRQQCKEEMGVRGGCEGSRVILPASSSSRMDEYSSLNSKEG